MSQPKDDLSRSLVALDQCGTLIAVVELSLATWLVGGMIPGIERDPLKKLVPDEEGLLKLLHRWCDEAVRAGHRITRIVVGFEAGRDGFWLARWLRARGIEAYVIHPTSIAVSREQRRAKSDRLDIGLLKRSLLGWLRGDKKHCTMAAIPTLEEEDAKRPNREREQLVDKCTGIVNRMKAVLVRLGIRGSTRNCAKRRNGLRRCVHRRGARFHPTHWPNSSAKWRIYVSFTTKSSRSRKHVWNS
jgi:transposase